MNKSTPRTLVFSFDGTGNEPDDATGFKQDESISNVLKLHVLMGGGLEEDRTATKTGKDEPQITCYYNGIGTREDGETIPLVGWLVSKTRKIVNSTLAPSWGDARRILKQAGRGPERPEADQGRPHRSFRVQPGRGACTEVRQPVKSSSKLTQGSRSKLTHLFPAACCRRTSAGGRVMAGTGRRPARCERKRAPPGFQHRGARDDRGPFARPRRRRRPFSPAARPVESKY